MPASSSAPERNRNERHGVFLSTLLRRYRDESPSLHGSRRQPGRSRGLAGRRRRTWSRPGRDRGLGRCPSARVPAALRRPPGRRRPDDRGGDLGSQRQGDPARTGRRRARRAARHVQRRHRRGVGRRETARAHVVGAAGLRLRDALRRPADGDPPAGTGDLTPRRLGVRRAVARRRDHLRPGVPRAGRHPGLQRPRRRRGERPAVAGGDRRQSRARREDAGQPVRARPRRAGTRLHALREARRHRLRPRARHGEADGPLHRPALAGCRRRDPARAARRARRHRDASSARGRSPRDLRHGPPRGTRLPPLRSRRARRAREPSPWPARSPPPPRRCRGSR